MAAETRVPERYQIPCGNCTATAFRRGDGWVKAALAGIWLTVTGTGLFLAGVFVGVPATIGFTCAGLLVAGLTILAMTVVLHTVVQLGRDLWKVLRLDAGTDIDNTGETVAGERK